MVVETQKRKPYSAVSSFTLKTVMSHPAAFSLGDSSRSAFSPYKPSVTVLTNLQRGNTKAVTNYHNDRQLSFFQLAAKGELTRENILSLENLNAFDSEDSGLTALMWASAFGQCHTCEDLLSAGAIPNLSNSSGQTALHFAAKAGYPEVVNVLMSFGAEVNYPDEKGNTALMFACMGNHPLTVSLLLSNRADFALTNDDKNTAYIEAITRHSDDAQQILENHIKTLLT